MNTPSNHCWHATGLSSSTLMTMNNTITSRLKCCRCGELGTSKQHERQGRLPGHGPFVEATYIEEDPVEYDVPCRPPNG